MRSKDVSWYWQKCGVLDYDEGTRRWLVQKTDSKDRVLTKDGEPLVNGGLDSAGHFSLLDTQYWIPRIQMMFLAEDPIVFAKRVAQAYHDRDAVEANIRYNLYLDCMPVDGLVEMSQVSLNNITHLAKNSTPKLRADKG